MCEEINIKKLWIKKLFFLKRGFRRGERKQIGLDYKFILLYARSKYREAVCTRFNESEQYTNSTATSLFFSSNKQIQIYRFIDS